MTQPSTPARAVGIKAAVEQQFSQVAANYRVSEVHTSGAELEKMIQMAGFQGHERVLDAGCGPGHAALALAAHVAQVAAVDLAEAMLEQGRQLAAARGVTNVEFRQADVERLPFEDETFDLVVSRYSAHHWPAPQSALREFRRVLRSNGQARGQFLLADVVSFDDFTADSHLQAMELLRDPSHVRDHTPGQWMTMLTVAGFQAELAYTWNLRLDFASWVRRMATPPAAVAMLKTLLANAPAEVRAALKVEEDFSFTLRCALLRCLKSAP
jgi:ubiquinone/menaquinone biosynthesis C-methylase UbiE